MTEHNEMRGIITPLVTPMTSTEELDKGSLRKLIEKQLDAGVAGLFCLGSSGEFTRLPTRTKQEVVKVVHSQVAGRVPVFVGVTDAGTRLVLDNLKKAEDLGAQYAVLSPPFYFQSSQQELLAFYETIASSTSLNLVLYNIPQLVGASLGVGVIKHLLPIENIIGIKDSSSDFGHFLELLQVTKPVRSSFRVYQGNDNLIGPSVLAGADGAVPGTANLVPEIFVNLCNKALLEEVQQTRALQTLASQWAGVYEFGASAIVGLKAAMHIMGQLSTPKVSSPFAQLDDSELACLADLLDGLRQQTSAKIAE